MDRIFIHNIEVKTTIGVWEWERKIKQTVLIDLEIDLVMIMIAEDLS